MTFQTIRITTHSHREILSIFAASLILVTALSFIITDKASAESFAPLTGQMDLGARGTNVSNLQTFLAANPSIYPQGLVTGYFGGLTFSAVKTFQGQYGFDQVGRAGPLTIAKMNSLIASGGWTLTDMSGPLFYNISRSIGSNQTSFTFTTNENVNAYVVYSTNKLMFNEGDINSRGFGAIGGFTVNSPNGLSMNHSITVSNLVTNTTYYYTIVATDAAGNISVVGPNNMFRTNQ